LESSLRKYTLLAYTKSQLMHTFRLGWRRHDGESFAPRITRISPYQRLLDGLSGSARDILTSGCRLIFRMKKSAVIKRDLTWPYKRWIQRGGTPRADGSELAGSYVALSHTCYLLTDRHSVYVTGLSDSERRSSSFPSSSSTTPHEISFCAFNQL
jgi:hypothetical protein